MSIDFDTRFLDTLDEPNLDVRRHNLVSDDIPEEEFDLVHGRLVLEHLPEPGQVIKRLVAALKPGGWIVLEDADWSPYLTEPDRTISYPDTGHEENVRVWRAALGLLRDSGFDEEYGRTLPADLIAQGLVDVGAEIRGRMLWGGSPGAAAPIGTLERLRGDLVSAGTVTEQEIDDAIGRFSDPERAGIGPLLVSAWGRRPPDEAPAAEGGHKLPPRTETVRSWLRSSPLFARTSEAELSRITSLADELHVDPGAELTVEGQAGNTFFVIAKGTATVTREGRRLAALGPGSYFGEIALLEQGPRTATVTADSRMWLFVFDAAGFASLMNGVQSVADEVFRALAERKRHDQSRGKR